MHTNTLLIVDDDRLLDALPEGGMSFAAYLRDYPKRDEPRIRVLNLCDSRDYLSEGYYCSLLAEARGHEVLPSLRMINDLRAQPTPQLWLAHNVVGKDSAFDASAEYIVCMGESNEPALRKLAQLVFQHYPLPLLHIRVTVQEKGVNVSLRQALFAALDDNTRDFCAHIMAQYARSGWRQRTQRKKTHWDLAILINPDEPDPPSNKGAISRFIKAGEKLGIRTEALTANQLQHISQYDGLFIRETTAIDHHTYRLACAAEQQGLVVIDDANSILRCCNKVFLHDAFAYRKVPSPQTLFLSRDDANNLARVEATFDYPLVLKLPEGSFSRGVFKVADREALTARLAQMFCDSALVLAQEYLYTEYDWRIGVLNGRPLYACRYYMARNHWQIYNHGAKRHQVGGFDTLPTFEAPRAVLDAALKAAAVVGNGLYGIDVKMLDTRAYAIEVNDNPNIDHGVEDQYLGDELYMQIMSVFLRRFTTRGQA